jgi:hypothetical protein
MSENDRPKHWRPYLEYLQRYGERKRAEGHESPDVADDAYWQKRRQDEANKQLPLSKAA